MLYTPIIVAELALREIDENADEAQDTLKLRITQPRFS
jgi:hypothetical protein